MRETLAISYTKCGFCTARNHCAACGAELSAALADKPGVSEAAVDLLSKTLRVEYDMDRDALEDVLDGMGLMAD